MHTVRRLLREIGCSPVLVDVGASGAPPRLWRAIRRESTYIGFDPDAREMRSGTDFGFARTTIIPQAVIADAGADEAPLYLTRSPFCSSTLPPDTEALSNYLFAPLFDVTNETRVPATSFSRLAESGLLQRVDWLKLDTQGTDLRLYESLPNTMRAGLLTLDVEPGLIDAYVGEDLFTTTHERLLREGWWLSRARVLGAGRIRRDSVARLQEEHGLDADALQSGLRVSPGWVEARYIRSLAHLKWCGATAADHQLLWAFATLDDQHGFAFDVVSAIERRFGSVRGLDAMRRSTLFSLRRGAPLGVMRRAARHLPEPLRRRLGSVISRLRGQ